MSIVHIVKVTGKSKADLVKALKGAIRELDGETISSGTTVTHTGSTSAVVDEEGYEEVESPYTNHAPAEELYGRGPVEIQHPNNTIVDNERDSENLPWDSRIHSSSKAKVNSGRWKQKKGVDEAVLAQVKAELYSRNAQNATPVQTAPLHIAPQPVVEQPVINQATLSATTPVIVAAQIQNQPALPGAALPPQQLHNGHTLDSFKGNFAQTISSLITQGKLSQDYVNMLTGHFGVQAIWQANAEQQAACFYEFVKCGIIQQVG